MENTNSIHFADDKAEWFVSVGEKFRGPFKASEIYQQLQSHEVNWIDYVYREKEGKWIKLSDHPVFTTLIPEPPKPKPVIAPVAAPPPPPKMEEEIKWFLFQQEAQTGPYPTSELRRLISAGQVHENAFVWQEKFTDWKPFGEVAELKSAPKAPSPPSAPGLHSSPKVDDQRKDKRTAPRKPLVAQIYVANQTALSTGICRDISVGGMQILTDRLPGGVGANVKLHVSPPADSGLSPFIAEGSIVRILEDQRGFSIRFSLISDEAKRSIESYIA
jgi:hypothetical protein